MDRWKYLIVFFLVIALTVIRNPLPVQASRIQYCKNMGVIVDGTEVCSIPAFDADYENHMYVSLIGLSYALQGTQKAFTPIIKKYSITILTGEDAAHAAEADELPAAYLWDDETQPIGENVSIAKHELLLNEDEKKYHSVILPHEKGYDAYLPPICLAMLFDMRMEVTEEALIIKTEEPFSVSAQELEASGYLQGVNALAAGDATAGELYYHYDAEEAFPIASTTKLMTYFVFMDAVSQGNCSLEDTTVISEQAATLSNGPDGVISMKAGTRVPLTELLHGMLIPSSNECALAIAEHTAGSEEAFVRMMNRKAAELGLTNTEFYNCHGLPVYADQLLPAKMHNHMTADEMFVMASALVNTYPQILTITSVKEYHLSTFNKDIKNTNALLYNIDHVEGLKTGTTNKAGSCLVTCASVSKDGTPHYLITVLFGADGDANRGIASEILVRYAEETLQTGGADILKVPAGETEPENGIPQDPERVIQKLLIVYPSLSFG